MTMPTDPQRYTVYLARTGERLEVEAYSLTGALRLAEHPDACVVEERPVLVDAGCLDVDPLDRPKPGPGEVATAFDVTFDPDHLTTVACRSRNTNQAETLRWALDCAVSAMDGEGSHPTPPEELAR